MLELRKLCKSFDNVIFTDVCFSFYPGKIYFILGESGLGKTTLLNMIRGVESIDSGSIIYFGENVQEQDYKRKQNINLEKITYVKQDSILFDKLSIIDNLKIVTRDISLIEQLISLAGLDYCKNDCVGKLSGGEQRRVSVLRSVLLNNDVILFDEPTSNIDYETAVEVMDLIYKISSNKIVIVVSHDEEICNTYADEILKIENHQLSSYTNSLCNIKKNELTIVNDSTSFIEKLMLNNKSFFINTKLTIVSVIFLIVICFFILIVSILNNSFNEFYIDDYNQQTISYSKDFNVLNIKDSEAFVELNDNITKAELGIPIMTSSNNEAFINKWGNSDDVYLEKNSVFRNFVLDINGNKIDEEDLFKTLDVENSYMYRLDNMFCPVIEGLLIVGRMPEKSNEVVLNLDAAYFYAAQSSLDQNVVKYSNSELLDFLNSNGFSITTFYDLNGIDVEERYYDIQIVGIVDDSTIENNHNTFIFEVEGYENKDYSTYNGFELPNKQFFILNGYEFKFNNNVYVMNDQYNELYYEYLSVTNDVDINNTELLDSIDYPANVINLFVLENYTTIDYFQSIKNIESSYKRITFSSFSANRNLNYYSAFSHDYEVLDDTIEITSTITLVLICFYIVSMGSILLLTNKFLKKDIESYKELNFSRKNIYNIYMIRFIIYQTIMFVVLFLSCIISLFTVFKLFAIPYNEIFYFTINTYNINYFSILFIVLTISILNIIVYAVLLYKSLFLPKQKLYTISE